MRFFPNAVQLPTSRGMLGATARTPWQKRVLALIIPSPKKSRMTFSSSWDAWTVRCRNEHQRTVRK